MGQNLPSRMDMGLKPGTNSIKSPSFNHPKKISQVIEGLLCENLGENVGSLLVDGQYCTEITMLCTSPRM